MQPHEVEVLKLCKVGYKWKTTIQEDNLTGRQPHRKTTLHEEKPTERLLVEDNHNIRKSLKETC